jgi:hypothetical protein
MQFLDATQWSLIGGVAGWMLGQPGHCLHSGWSLSMGIRALGGGCQGRQVLATHVGQTSSRAGRSGSPRRFHDIVELQSIDEFCFSYMRLNINLVRAAVPLR